MNPKTYSIKNQPKNYYNKFPENRDFFFLDSIEKIRDFKTTNFEDPEYICVVAENKENKIKENLYIRKDFLNDYEFIKVTENNSKIGLNFIVSKSKINKGGRENRLLSEIKSRQTIMREIYKRIKINFLTNNMIYFKELFTIPNELKFYQGIFILFIQNPTNLPNNQNQQNNNYNNSNNNGFINNGNNNIYNNGLNNKDNNIANNQYQTNNNIFNTPGINNANININNNNIQNHQNYQNIYNISNNNNNNINNQISHHYLPNNNNGNNLDPNTFQFNNTKFNQNIRDFNSYVYNAKTNTNVSNNQNNNTQAETYPPQAGSNLQQGPYPHQNRTLPNQQGAYPHQKGALPNQQGISLNQPGSNNPQSGSNNPQTGSNDPQLGSNNPQSGSNNSQQQGQYQPNSPNPNYLFSKKGLKNIGSTCYMNATLQCLLHVNELITYFIEEYPKDQQQLAKINNDVASGGDISRAFFNLVMGVNENSELVMSKKNLKPKTKKKSGFNILGVFGFDNDYDDSSYDRAFAPTDFKRTLGNHNPQFKKFEANDSKDLILYLLQTMHEELNYYGNVNKRLKYIPNQYNIYETYNHFITNYNTNNFSKISLLFYGTYQNTTTCLVCRKKLYNFQKFEFISFGLYYYHEKKFNILNGFQDNANPTVLKGDNKFLCNNCKKLQDAKTECKIFEPPLKLLINLDYGKNKKYQPSKIEFDEEIDITKFVEFDYKQKIRYRIIGVCTHYGHSGSYGHYVAFCRNTQTNTWYEFNDSFCSECNKKEIYRGSPYLLLYERIFN